MSHRIALLAFVVASTATAGEPLFKHSDVIAFTAGKLDDYRDYGVDFVAWGGYPRPDAQSVAKFRSNLAESLKVGTRIGAKIGTRTDFAGFIDFAQEDFAESRCIQVDGTPIIVPDMLTVQYRGHPAYWFCTNSPKFRDYLKRNARVAMECEPYGILMDDPYGTAAAAQWFGGCYCKFCIAAFRAYLKRRFSPDELQAKGISDIDRFDLREYHQPSVALKPPQRPLYREVVDFQSQNAAQMFHEVMAYAIQVRGKQVPVSGNINPASTVQGRMFLTCDYYCCECDMGAKTGALDKGSSLLAFKLADALGRPVSIMGSGGDHAFLQERHLPGMLRCWAAEAYAHGNYFSAPYYLWAYTPEKGSHGYRPRDTTELAPLYQFIKHHTALFDGYESVARLAVVYSYELARRKPGSSSGLIRRLASANVPFDLVIAGDEQLDIHLDADRLARYDAIVVPTDAALERTDANTLKQYEAAGGRLLPETAELPHATALCLTGASSVCATLRTANTRPVVIHLLNRDYDNQRDACTPKGPFTLQVPKVLLSGVGLRRAKYVQPPLWNPKAADDSARPMNESPEVELSVTGTQDHWEIAVPSLDFWGVVVVSE